jgi:hypothetical protein
MSSATLFQTQLKTALTYLQHDQAAVRRRAIKWLGESRHPEAVKWLEQVIQNDPEPDLRAYAEKALLYIQGYVSPAPSKEIPTRPQASQANLITQTAPLVMQRGAKDYYKASTQEMAAVVQDYEVYAYQEPTSGKAISQRDWEDARRLVTDAQQDYVDGLPVAALKKLGKALEIDRTIARDKATRHAVGQLMDMPYKEALKTLAKPDLREAYIDRRRMQERHGVRILTRWTDVARDFALFFGVQAVGLLIFLAALVSRSGRLMAYLRADRNYGADVRITGQDPAAGYQFIAAYLGNADQVMVLIYAAGVASVLALILLLGHAAAHVLARFLRGDGRLTETLSNLFVIPTWALAGVYLTGAVFIYLVYPGNYPEVVGWQTNLLTLGAWSLVAVAGWVAYRQSRLIAFVHHIPVAMGAIVFGTTTVLLIAMLYAAIAYVPNMLL